MKIEPIPRTGIQIAPQTDWELMYLLSEEGTSFKLVEIDDNGESTFILKPFLE